MGALRKEKIEFLLIGMSAAIFQGVPGSTIDVDFWINLPARQYMRPMKIDLAQGPKDLVHLQQIESVLKLKRAKGPRK